MNTFYPRTQFHLFLNIDNGSIQWRRVEERFPSAPEQRRDGVLLQVLCNFMGKLWKLKSYFCVEQVLKKGQISCSKLYVQIYKFICLEHSISKFIRHIIFSGNNFMYNNVAPRIQHFCISWCIKLHLISFLQLKIKKSYRYMCMLISK